MQSQQNADIAADIGDDEPIGVIIEAPSRDKTDSSTLQQPETVVEDLVGEDNEEEMPPNGSS